MLINLSNHPFSLWEEEQKNAAIELYIQVEDIAFPNIKPEWNTEQVEILAYEYYSKCENISTGNRSNTTIHLMGEFIFCFLLAQILLKNGYTCVASASQRNVRMENGEKISTFTFGGFREYKIL